MSKTHKANRPREPKTRITVKDLEDYLNRERISFEEYLKRFLIKRGYLKEEDDSHSETDMEEWIREAMEE